MREQGRPQERLAAYESEGRKLFEDLLREKAGISFDQLKALPEKQRREIARRVRDVFQDPEVGEILERRTKKSFGAQDAAAIRKIVGIEKWNQLDELVAYVRTLVGDFALEEREKKYQEHLAFGVDANEIKCLLSRVNDVLPARIDTDIKHQSTMFYRAVVELASNALDASKKEQTPIGRFGVGFYQVLNHLRDPEDRLVVLTRAEDEAAAVRIEFRNRNGQIDFKISQDPSVEHRGTTIELRSRDFKERDGADIIREYFSHTQDVRVMLNRQRVNHWKPSHSPDESAETPTVELEMSDGRLVVRDAGIGMNPRVVFEKLLVPKLSDKPPVYEIREKKLLQPKLHVEAGDDDQAHPTSSCEVIVQVGGIMVEKMLVHGMNIAKTVVIDLPPSTILGEQRDAVEVDRYTADAMKGIVDQALALPEDERFKVLNALGKVCRHMQDRSRECSAEHNIYTYAQKRIRESFPDHYFLPNQKEFTALKVGPKTHLLDPDLYQSPLNTIPDLWVVEGWAGTAGLYTADFREGDLSGMIATSDYCILDARSNPAANPELTSRVIQLETNRYGENFRQNNGAQRGWPGRYERREVQNFESLVRDRWKDFFIDSEEIALRSARYLESAEPVITQAFERLLSLLPSGSAVEGWQLLEFFVMKDRRPAEQKLIDIHALATNVENLLSHPLTREMCEAYRIPIFSMFETVDAHWPLHLQELFRNIGGYFKGRVEVDGKSCFVFSDWRGEGRTLVSEGGEIITVPAEEVSTLEPQPIDRYSGAPAPERRPLTPHQVLEDAAKNRYEIKNGELFINGERQIELGAATEVTFEGMMLDEHGNVLILATNDRLRSRGSKERFYLLLNARGDVIWQLDERAWGEKIYVHENMVGYRYAGRSDVQMLEEFYPRAIPILHQGIVSENDPVIKIVRYGLMTGARFREIIGYVDAAGREHRISDAHHINEVTLDAKYTWESNCACCGADREFEKGSYLAPFPEKYSLDGEPMLEYLQKISVAIIGSFRYDVSAKEWQAIARDKKGDKCRAVFNEQGAFLRIEYIYAHEGHILETTQDMNAYHLLRAPGNLVRGYQSDLSELLNGWRQRTLLVEKIGDGSISHFVESDPLKDGLLSAGIGRLGPEHSEALADFLSQYPVPQRDRLERVVYRTLQFRHLSAEDLRLMLPAFYQIDDLQPECMAPSVIEELRRVSTLDAERFVALVSLLHRCLPKDPVEQKQVAAKIVKFYQEKLQHESSATMEEMLYEMRKVRQYGESLTADGYTLVRHKTKAPPNMIPRGIRPFITFLQSEEQELASNASEVVVLPETKVRELLLSEIIQWKRSREGDARGFSGTPDDLFQHVSNVTKGKSREHLCREITHAVHFQSLNSTDLYLRELVQNAVDALVSSGVDPERRNIEVVISTSGDQNITTHFTDQVGMDIQTLINYFLVPGETTKGDKKSIGFYGQGVYTLFKGAEEVLVKTGTGDGKTWFMKMTPVMDREMIVDVRIDVRMSDESFKGTTISKTQKTENPYVEAAYIRDSLMTLVSALDDSRGSIYLQGQKINESYGRLHTGTTKDGGETVIFKNPNMIVTQNGLYVKELGNEYLGLVPAFMGKALKGWGGIAIDLPREIELTRSRQDIANKDKVAPDLDPQIQKDLASAYLKTFAEKVAENPNAFPFNELPYDYFSNDRYVAPTEYAEDAAALLGGRPLQRLEDYSRPSKAIKLMTLLPVFPIGDRKMSLEDLRSALRVKEYPFNKESWETLVPRPLLTVLAEKVAQRKESDRQKEEAKEQLSIGDRTLDELVEAAPEELRSWIEAERGDLDVLDQLTKEFLRIVTPIYHPGRTTLFNSYYYKYDNSIAHATLSTSPLVGWNLQAMKGWDSMLAHIQKSRDPKEGRYQSKEELRNTRMNHLLEILGVLAHEVAHTTESRLDWSHGISHQQEQARVLIQFMAHQGTERLIKAMEAGAVEEGIEHH